MLAGAFLLKKSSLDFSKEVINCSFRLYGQVVSYVLLPFSFSMQDY